MVLDLVSESASTHKFGTNEDVDEALLLRRRVAELEHPSTTAIKAARLELLEADGTSKYGRDATYLFDSEEDLVSLSPGVDQDAISRFIRLHWPFRSSAGSSPIPDPTSC